MKNSISDDSIERTISACAWLIGIAQRSGDCNGWNPVIVRYLEQLGQGAYAVKLSQQGGMGAVAPMERSAAAAEMSASTDVCREISTWHADTTASRHDEQFDLCVPHSTLLL
jgi:hypothetical protein